MKKIMLILITIFVWQLSSAQRYYVISEAQAKEWKQYRITWFFGIDPVQLKDGSWVISEKCYYEMTNRFVESKTFSTGVKLRADSVRIELEKYPARIVRKDEWKTYDEAIGEKEKL
jgi:hypothetical protein